MPNELGKALDGVFGLPLLLTVLLAVAIVIATRGANPWHKQYGTAAWDFSQSFAANLAALTGAINAIIAAATMTSGTDVSKKAEVMLGVAVFVIFTACAPLIASIWKTPANETAFLGVAAGILSTGFGVFGQLQALIALAHKQAPLATYSGALYFADVVVFVYCVSTARRLAYTPPIKTIMLSGSREASVLDRWALP